MLLQVSPMESSSPSKAYLELEATLKEINLRVTKDKQTAHKKEKTFAKKVAKKARKEKVIKRKHAFFDSDSDFENPKKKGKTSETEELNYAQPFEEFMEIKLWMRCSPINLWETIQTLTEEQKACVREMGFGSILQMNIKNIPTALGYWLLVNYNHHLNELNVGNHIIKITPSLVHEILGIPMGNIKVLEKNKPRKGASPKTDVFKDQFTMARISIRNVVDKIKESRDTGAEFKLNFLVVFNTIMGFMTKSTTVNQRFIKAIKDYSDISKMDWCSYVIDNLKSTKEGWKGINTQYSGPITFLVVLYTHKYQKRHGALGDPIQTPAFNYITTDSLKKMERYLYDNGPLTPIENIERNENEEFNVNNFSEKQGEPSFENEEIDNNQSGDNENDESDTVIDGEPITNLLPKSIKLTTVDFSPEERAFYQKLEVESRSQFKIYADAGTVSENYENILLMLLRLRQACDHLLLVKGFSSESISRFSRMAKNLPKYMQSYLLNLLEALNICCLCSDKPEDAVVTLCGHVFCYQCVSGFLTGDDNTCPSPKCKSPIGSDVVFNKSTLRNSISDDNGLQQDYISSKIKAAVEIIQTNCRSKSSGVEGLPIKAVVFSHWTKMLDLFEMSLDQNHIEYRRLDGSMSYTSKDHVVNQFNTDPKVSVMLMSLKANNLDLNKLAASHVILLDLWWNPTTEDQAIDRISQPHPVTVTRLTVKDTVEDRIFKLQDEKRKTVGLDVGEDQCRTSNVRLTAEDLKYLFMGHRGT